MKGLKFVFSDISISFLVFWSKERDWNISKNKFQIFCFNFTFQHAASGFTFYKYNNLNYFITLRICINQIISFQTNAVRQPIWDSTSMSLSCATSSSPEMPITCMNELMNVHDFPVLVTILYMLRMLFIDTLFHAGFDNYKIVICDHVCVPQFWCMCCTWANTKNIYQASYILPSNFSNIFS